MSMMDRTTPFRLLLVVVERLPHDAGARRLFGRSLLRHWYGTSRMFDRTSLLLISRDGMVDVVVGAKCRPLLRDAWKLAGVFPHIVEADQFPAITPANDQMGPHSFARKSLQGLKKCLST